MGEAVSVDYFKMDGVANLEVDGTSFAFLFKGDINKIIDRIHGKKINNLMVEEPSLEEIFLHYYEKEG